MLAGRANGVLVLVNGNASLGAVNTVAASGIIAAHKAEIKDCYALGGAYVMPEDTLWHFRYLLNAEDPE